MNDSQMSSGWASSLGGSLATSLAHSDGLAQFILLVLLVMSVSSWYLILLRGLGEWRRAGRSRAYLNRFRQARNLEAAAVHVADEPFSRLVQAASQAWYRIGLRDRQAPGYDLGTSAELLARALRRALVEEGARQESGLAVLASVAASAPFVGLFGTVWGIYHALMAIGANGQASLGQVAGPVGEALVMTALGLSVAIPAVLGYNAIQRKNRVLQTDLDGFAQDIYALLAGCPPVVPPREAE